jgi:2-amino-4-hydroxy-6-hydroxymethyldihydropteridine diphosphokinase
MKSQHQVILSIGGNQGNRLENVKHCIELIHQIGTVIKVSRIYETPSWGFDGDAFYNCALVYTLLLRISYQALKLKRGLAYEKDKISLIDIDLIAYDEEIVILKAQVHPFMQDRKFVLLPIQDLNLVGSILF